MTQSEMDDVAERVDRFVQRIYAGEFAVVSLLTEAHHTELWGATHVQTTAKIITMRSVDAPEP